jgi:hypothetical protein
MTFCLFIVFRDRARGAARITDDEHARLGRILPAVPRLARALVHTPAHAHDPFLDDGAPPPLALQLYFGALIDLEAAASRDGAQALARRRAPDLDGAAVEQQAMAGARMPRPSCAVAAREPCCTIPVAYQGRRTIRMGGSMHTSHHSALMARLPGIREIEIYTGRLTSGLPWPRAEACSEQGRVRYCGGAYGGARVPSGRRCARTSMRCRLSRARDALPDDDPRSDAGVRRMRIVIAGAGGGRRARGKLRESGHEVAFSRGRNLAAIRDTGLERAPAGQFDAWP